MKTEDHGRLRGAQNAKKHDRLEKKKFTRRNLKFMKIEDDFSEDQKTANFEVMNMKTEDHGRLRGAQNAKKHDRLEKKKFTRRNMKFMKIEDDFSEDQRTTNVEAAKYEDRKPRKASKSAECGGTLQYGERKKLEFMEPGCLKKLTDKRSLKSARYKIN